MRFLTTNVRWRVYILPLPVLLAAKLSCIGVDLAMPPPDAEVTAASLPGPMPPPAGFFLPTDPEFSQPGFGPPATPPPEAMTLTLTSFPGLRFTEDDMASDEWPDTFLTPLQRRGLGLLTTGLPTGRGFEVACFDCHPAGHTNAAFIRSPEGAALRYDAPSLRGVGFTAPFTYKRQVLTLEEFVFTEAHSAYFGGAPEGFPFTREDEEAMHAMLAAIGFPPNQKLRPDGWLDPDRATSAELRGQAVFQQRCASCHPAPFYTDGLAYDLQAERFFGGGPEGLFNVPTLRAISESPPYLHDGRFATLEQAVDFFSLVLDIRLTAQEKADLLTFLRAL